MIECIKYTQVNKGNLLGFASIYVDKWDLEIHSLTINNKDGKKWVGFPSQAYEKDGEKKYSPYVRMRTKENYFKFCDAIVEAVEKKMNEFVTPQTDSSQEEIPF